MESDDTLAGLERQLAEARAYHLGQSRIIQDLERKIATERRNRTDALLPGSCWDFVPGTAYPWLRGPLGQKTEIEEKCTLGRVSCTVQFRVGETRAGFGSIEVGWSPDMVFSYGEKAKLLAQFARKRRLFVRVDAAAKRDLERTLDLNKLLLAACTAFESAGKKEGE